MEANVYGRTFARAAEILGGEQQLADHLKVDLERLSHWAMGKAQPPAQVFIALAEILKQELLKTYEPSRSGQTPVMFRRRSGPTAT
jgi:hypothetical protein